MLVTGLPRIVSGMTSSPVASVSQSVMVTSPPVVIHVRELGRGRVTCSIINPFQVDPISPNPARKPSDTMTTAPAAILSKMLAPRVVGTGPVNVMLVRPVQPAKV